MAEKWSPLLASAEPGNTNLTTSPHKSDFSVQMWQRCWSCYSLSKICSAEDKMKFPRPFTRMMELDELSLYWVFKVLKISLCNAEAEDASRTRVIGINKCPHLPLAFRSGSSLSKWKENIIGDRTPCLVPFQTPKEADRKPFQWIYLLTTFFRLPVQSEDETPSLEQNCKSEVRGELDKNAPFKNFAEGCS